VASKHKRPGIRKMPKHEITVHIKNIKEWLHKNMEENGRGVYRLTSIRYGKMCNDIHPKGRKTLDRREIAYYSTVLYNILSYWKKEGDEDWECKSSDGLLFTIKFKLKEKNDGKN